MIWSFLPDAVGILGIWHRDARPVESRVPAREGLGGFW